MKTHDEFFEEYFNEAVDGTNTDWATYDEAKSISTLIDVYKILRSDDRYDHRVALAYAVIDDLIRRAAEHHAEQVMSECTCRTPPARYDSVSPPEPVLNRDCPVHGCGPDERNER